MAQGQSNHVPGPYFYSLICPKANPVMSQVHHYYQENGPGTIKPCPRSMFLIINMSQVLSFIVPGPSLLPKEWPRDNQTMSLVHHYYLKNGPGTIEPCPGA